MENQDLNVVIDCPHADYSSDFLEVQAQLIAVQEKQVELIEAVKGGNSILLLILILLCFSYIFKLLRFIF